jgi:hypothetical protein
MDETTGLMPLVAEKLTFHHVDFLVREIGCGKDTLAKPPIYRDKKIAQQTSPHVEIGDFSVPERETQLRDFFEDNFVT